MRSAGVLWLSSRGQEFIFHKPLQVQIFVIQVKAQELLHHSRAPVGITYV